MYICIQAIYIPAVAVEMACRMTCAKDGLAITCLVSCTMALSFSPATAFNYTHTHIYIYIYIMDMKRPERGEFKE